MSQLHDQQQGLYETDKDHLFTYCGTWMFLMKPRANVLPILLLGTYWHILLPPHTESLPDSHTKTKPC